MNWTIPNTRIARSLHVAALILLTVLMVGLWRRAVVSSPMLVNAAPPAIVQKVSDSVPNSALAELL